MPVGTWQKAAIPATLPPRTSGPGQYKLALPKKPEVPSLAVPDAPCSSATGG